MPNKGESGVESQAFLYTGKTNCYQPWQFKRYFRIKYLEGKGTGQPPINLYGDQEGHEPLTPEVRHVDHYQMEGCLDNCHRVLILH